ncbi:MAG: hypothetical protein GPJ51_12970 [Candidatus Heimdallarchaeota archaeon]|nr:hypothetical protein [Candidatus Heimdallarchaeota archaeon]
MLEKEIQELEEILLPFAVGRLGKMFVSKKFKRFFEWIVRAYVRCLFNITDEIHLLEITTVAIAEAYYMDEIKIFNVYDTVIKQFTTSGTQMASGEIHQWFIYLQEKEKLPGIYNRFTGKYRIK